MNFKNKIIMGKCCSKGLTKSTTKRPKPMVRKSGLSKSRGFQEGGKLNNGGKCK